MTDEEEAAASVVGLAESTVRSFRRYAGVWEASLYEAGEKKIEALGGDTDAIARQRLREKLIAEGYTPARIRALGL